MSLWDWARAAYATPAAEAALLALQDEHDQCVSYLLWAAWAAKTGGVIDADTARRAAALSRDWSDLTLAPLRTIRRTLKAGYPGLADEGREIFRQRIKDDELAAEGSWS